MTEFNKDELEAPDWMNKEFFKNVLQKCENSSSIVINEVKMSPATAKGDHYASVMFRATLSYETNKAKGLTKPLIIKTMPELDGHKKGMIGESMIFETEISMYSETIPKLEAELRKIGDDTVLGAKVLYYSLEPKKCIIFEDIVPLGYETLRHRMANLEETKGALLKLAKWHAVSHKLGYEGDTSITKYKEGIFSLKEFEASDFMQNGVQMFIEKLDTIDELKKYVPKLRSLQKDILKRCANSFDTYRSPNPEGIFVLCHGDFHSKNMMFKRNDKGGLEDVMLLDFQVCYFGPAVLDLLYGMIMVTDVDARQNHYEEIIYFYCSNFIETLKKINFKGKIPKVSDFYIDLIRHSHWELFLVASFLPLWHALFSKPLDVEEVLTSNETRRNFYDNEDFIEEAKRLLPKMFFKGYLE